MARKLSQKNRTECTPEEEKFLRDRTFELSRQLEEMRHRTLESPKEKKEFLRLEREFDRLYEEYSEKYAMYSLVQEEKKVQEEEHRTPNRLKRLAVCLAGIVFFISALAVGSQVDTDTAAGQNSYVAWEENSSVFGEGYLISSEEQSTDGDVSVLTTDNRIPDLTSLENIDQKPHRCHFNWIAIDGITEFSWSPQIYTETYEVYRKAGRYMDSEDFYRYISDVNNQSLITELAHTLESMGEGMGYSRWELAMEAANFVQSISYQTDLESTGAEEWPKYAVETVYDEAGDCEDKAILLSGLLNELGFTSVLVVFDGHTGVGIAGEEKLQGTWYPYNGLHCYYIEPSYTGWGIGRLPEALGGKQAVCLHL